MIQIQIDFAEGFRYTSKLRSRIIDIATEQTKHRLREQIRDEGIDGDGKALRGYSTHPIWIPASAAGREGQKPITYPSTRSRTKNKVNPNTGGAVTVRRHGIQQTEKGKSVFYRGGYKAYRPEVGLPSARFTLSNKGTLWRRWAHGRNGKVGVIGWNDKRNYDAAQAAVGKGRPKMFDLSAANEAKVTGDIGAYVAEQVAASMAIGKRRIR